MNNKRTFTRRSFLIHLHTLLVGVIIIGGMAGIAFCIVSAVHKNTTFLLVSIVFTFGILIILVISAVLYGRSAYGKSPLKPYEFSSEYHSGREVLDSISNYLHLHTLPEAVFCARTTSGSYYINCFLFYIPQFDSYEFKQMEKRSVLSAIDACLISAKMSRDTFLHSARCNIIVTDSMNENLSRFINKNALDRLCCLEGIVDCVVDLSDAKIYLPALWGGYSGQLKKYRKIVRELDRILVESVG